MSVVKRGRIPHIQDFKFTKIIGEDMESKVQMYLETLDVQYQEKHLTPVFDAIYEFYLERKNKNDGIKKFENFVENFTCSKKDFRKMLLGWTESYIGYEEISYYYYLKYKIDDLFECDEKTRYFNDREETAIREYILCEDKNRRELLYMKFLDFPFTKLVESIINKYKLYSETHTFEELQHDTVSFLHSKLDKFDAERGTKAYSYLGTIAKHRLQAIRIGEEKTKKRTHSYEEAIADLSENERYSYYDNHYERNFMVEFSQKLPMIFTTFIGENQLKPEEVAIGNAIIDIMSDWDSINTTSNKINKNVIFECIRNITGLSTKDIRNGLKKFKAHYDSIKKDMLNEDYNPLEFQ